MKKLPRPVKGILIIVVFFATAFLFSPEPFWAPINNGARLNEGTAKYLVFLYVIKEEMETPGDNAETDSSKNEKVKVEKAYEGSGFFIADNGPYILTNYHVIAGEKEIYFFLENEPRYHKAEVVGFDRMMDLALLKPTDQSFAPPGTAPLGDWDKLKPGDKVFAFGSPYGLRFLMSAGIIMKTNVRVPGAPYPVAVLTDAKINPGNSGGVLINKKGEVVAVNASLQGINPMGISIPINIVKNILPRLKAGGEVKHAYLGVKISSTSNFTPFDYKKWGVKEPNRPGVFVVGVIPQSPAHNAGLQTGDVIISYNDLPIEKIEDFETKFALEARPGDEINLSIARENEMLIKKIMVSGQPKQLIFEGIPGWEKNQN